MTVDELMKEFHELSVQDKLAFFKKIMPALCENFKNDPQKMMGEMMPLCREMMQTCGMDMEQMRRMMNRMRQLQD